MCGYIGCKFHLLELVVTYTILGSSHVPNFGVIELCRQCFTYIYYYTSIILSYFERLDIFKEAGWRNEVGN